MLYMKSFTLNSIQNSLWERRSPLISSSLRTSKEFNAPFDPIVSKGDLQEYRRILKLQTFINSLVFMFLMTIDIISTVLVFTF